MLRGCAMPPKPHRSQLVSIVIPTYNQADFLAEALASINAQSFTNWEAIVVNNFSSDHTTSVVEALRDERFTLINYANEGIIARSRNIGIAAANGDFVAFLDSDDLWEVDKLARCIERLEQGFDLVCHAEQWFGGGQPVRVVRYGPTSQATYASLLGNGNCISTSATVVRKDVLLMMNGFRDRSEFVTTEDYDLWLRIARAGYRIDFLDEVLGSFRRHSASASSATTQHLNAELAVIGEHFSCAPKELRRRERRRTAFAYYAAARSFSKSGSSSDAMRSFLRSLSLAPLAFRTWAGLFVHCLMVLRRTSIKISHNAR